MRAFQIYLELIKYRDCDVHLDMNNIHNSYVVFITAFFKKMFIFHENVYFF